MNKIAASLIAPLGTPLVIIVAYLVLAVFGAVGESVRWSAVLGFTSVATVVAYLVMLTLGWMAILIAHVCRWSAAFHFVVMGFIVGATPFILFPMLDLVGSRNLSTISIDEIADLAYLSLWGGIPGLVSALLFWKLVWGRHERDA
ncbi:MAG: hypothetical protein OER80_11930 [Gammaproteobacteria bacterium]|nr:hypothetical protein [Gammaproteobacteria bacterium]